MNSNFLYFDHQQRLTLQCGSALPAAESLLQRAGYTQLAAGLTVAPSAQALLAAVEEAYAQGYEQQASTEFELKGLAFAGYGDPLLHLALLEDVLPALKTQRHGVPVTLVTYGLVATDQAVACCQQLHDLGVEKLEVYLPAANPAAYQQAVQPKQQGFAEVCQFIHTAAEVGIHVSCFAYAPIKHSAELRGLARELGARQFLTLPIASLR